MTTGAASYMAPTGPDILPTWAIRCSGLPEVWRFNLAFEFGMDCRFPNLSLSYPAWSLSYPAAGAAAGTSLALASLA